jgi:glutathione synthase/RimK-type ligase-like ATP-grasp enzyme
MRRALALATCAEVADGDPDDAGLPAALAAQGVHAAWAVWDDESVDWSRFDGVLVRSTWDYHGRRDAFLDWARSVPRVLNAPGVLAWNTDKRYLGELAAAGLPVVRTTFVTPGRRAALPDDAFVVKPAVSAGSRDTARFAGGEDARARALVADIAATGRVAMIQPYLESVDAHGETALVFLAGRFSHAIRKGALLVEGQGPTQELFAAEQIAPCAPRPAELDIATRVVAHATARFGVLPYARVDLVAAEDGAPLVLELELTEPSLFFAHGPAEAPERLAAAVAASLA